MSRTWMVAAFSLLAGSAAAEKLVINGAGEVWTKPCEGNDVVVNGAGHRLTFTGECGKLVVNGTGQAISVEAATKIVINGTNNQVTWQRGARKLKKPKIGISGIGNKAVKGQVVAAAGTATATATGSGAATATPVTATATTPPAAPAGGSASAKAMSFGDNNLKVVKACGGANVDVGGNENIITLTGECGRVTISGNENKLDIDAAAEIYVVGNDNKVRWKKGVKAPAPRLSNVGNDNLVSQWR